MTDPKREGACERCRERLLVEHRYDMLVHQYRWLCDQCAYLGSSRRPRKTDQEQVEILREHASPPPRNRTLFAGSILVVEDDSDLRESLCNILEEEGFSTLKAGNGQEALDFLHNAQPSELPDVILLDLMMPVMNGSTFYARMCLDTSLSAVRVIVMTAHGSSRDSLKRLPLLRKPLHIEELLSAIRAAS